MFRVEREPGAEKQSNSAKRIAVATGIVTLLPFGQGMAMAESSNKVNKAPIYLDAGACLAYQEASEANPTVGKVFIKVGQETSPGMREVRVKANMHGLAPNTPTRGWLADLTTDRSGNIIGCTAYELENAVTTSGGTLRVDGAINTTTGEHEYQFFVGDFGSRDAAATSPTTVYVSP